MSKQILVDVFSRIEDNEYSWEIYLFKINRKKEQSFFAHKFRFSHIDAKNNYCKGLAKYVTKYQIDQIQSVQEYDGSNPKIVCDKISITNTLIAREYTKFHNAIASSSDSPIDKANGYAICGQPVNTASGLKAVTMIKLANPIIKLTDKKATIFTANNDNSWDLFSDEVSRFYWNCDLAIIDKELYAFNLKFEELFYLEKTLHNKKTQIIDLISTQQFFENNALFIERIKKHDSRIFVAYNSEKVNRLSDNDIKLRVASNLKIEIRADGSFDIQTEKQAIDLLRFLCDKKCKEIDTDIPVDVNGIVK